LADVLFFCRCRVNVSGIELGLWNVVVTPECGEAAQCYLDGALNIIDDE